MLPKSSLQPLTLADIAALLPPEFPRGDSTVSPAQLAAAIGPIHGWAVDLGRQARISGMAPLVAHAAEALAGLHGRQLLSKSEVETLTNLVSGLQAAGSAEAVSQALAHAGRTIGESPSAVASMLLGIGHNSARRAPVVAAAGVGVVVLVDIVGGALGAWVGSLAGLLGAIVGGAVGAVVLSYIVI